jgi:hypothetical protein
MLVEQGGPAVDPRPSFRGLVAIMVWKERRLCETTEWVLP